MAITESTPRIDEGEDKALSFRPAATEVLQSLRHAIAATLAGIGDFGKPADLFKTLRLDRTLSRQLYRLASGTETLANGGMIPSRTSIDRFLEVAKARGAGEGKIADVRRAYQAFEELVQVHAGDRATFNSMVSATNGVDEDWLAADLQHRRNAFRAMSHALGMQSKTRFTTCIIKPSADGSSLAVVLLGGMIGLRVLRSLPNLHVHGSVGDSPSVSSRMSSRPLGLSEAGDGYVIEQFSSSPLPKLTTRSGPTANGLGREIVIERPVVGNVGSSTLTFGTVFTGLPLEADEPIRVHTATTQPTEKLLFDVLIHPDVCGRAKPTGRSVIGFQMGAAGPFGSATVNLQGDFDPEPFGKGPRGLATLEMPSYLDLLDTVGTKMGWNLGDFEAWRLRLEFPLFQSTATLEWGRP